MLSINSSVELGVGESDVSVRRMGLLAFFDSEERLGLHRYRAESRAMRISENTLDTL